MSLAVVGTVTAGVGLGAQIYGATQAGKGVGSPTPPVDILNIATSGKNKGTSLAGRQASKLFKNYYPSVFPQVLGLQEQYTPQFLEQAFGFGGQGLTGLQALQRTAGSEAAQSMADLRAQELGQMTGQVPLTRGLMEALSPEQAAAVRASAQEAERARVSAQGVTPEEQRMYQQAAREAAQASGRLGGNAAIASEIMGRENVMARKRAEAAEAGQRAYSLAGQFYTTPGLGILGSTPASYTAGTSLAGTGLQLGQTLGPNIDYNLPLNLAQQRAAGLNQYNQAVYQTNLANQQAKAQMWQGIGSGLMSAGLNMAGGGFNFGGAGGGATQTAASPWGNVRYSYI